ncbi:sodium/solute symporter [Streptomyces puniciscabiei]
MAAASGLTAPVVAFLLVTCSAFLICLAIGARDADDRTADFFVANRSLPAVWNAVAMNGDYTLVTFLSAPVGAVAIGGYDGMVLAVCAVAGLGVVAVLAEPLRNTGSFTLGSVLEHHTQSAAVRVAGGLITLVVSAPLAVIQLTVAGDAIAFLLGLDGSGAAETCTVMIGLLMISFAAFGGMRGSSVLAMGKALLLLVTLTAAGIAVVNRFDWSPGALLAAAAKGSGKGEAFNMAGQLFGASLTGHLEFVSVCITVVLGSGVLPAMLMRVSTSRSGRSARCSVRYAVLGYGLFSGVLVLLGLGATAIVGRPALIAHNARGNTALFLLSAEIANGRDGILFTLISCALFLAALGAVAGLTLAAAASLVHDVYPRGRWGRKSDEQEVRMARWMVIGFGVTCIVLAVRLHNWNILFLLSYATAVAASVILPALLQTLFWKGHTRTGLLWTLHGGLVCCTVLQLASPTVSGNPVALFPNLDFQWFPLRNIALVSVPFGFLLGWAGSRLSRRSMRDATSFSEVEVRTLTGIDTA